MGQSSLGGGSLNRDLSRSLSDVFFRSSMVDAPIRPENAEVRGGRKEVESSFSARVFLGLMGPSSAWVTAKIRLNRLDRI